MNSSVSPRLLRTPFLVLLALACGACGSTEEARDPSLGATEAALAHQLALDAAKAKEAAALAARGPVEPRRESAQQAQESPVKKREAPARENRKEPVGKKEQAGKKEIAKKEPAKKRDIGFEIEKKVREHFLASLEVDIAIQKNDAAKAKASGELASARLALVLATDASKHYQKVEAPVHRAGLQLTIDRGAFSLEQELLELEQMEAGYADFRQDEHSRKTGEIVTANLRKEVEFKCRSLERAQAALEDFETYQLPRKKRELTAAVEEKERAMERARAAIERTRFESKLAQTRAENKLSILEYELAALRAEESKK